MENAIINAFIENLPLIMKIIFTILGVIVTNKLVPFIATKTQNNKAQTVAQQLETIMEWASVFVDSAQRLDKSGKLAELTNLTKKEYVMDKLMAKIKELDYDFTEDQLDQIRRSVVYALEQTEAMIEQTKQEVKEITDEQN